MIQTVSIQGHPGIAMAQEEGAGPPQAKARGWGGSEEGGAEQENVTRILSVPEPSKQVSEPPNHSYSP